jgi:hypothetical protein
MEIQGPQEATPLRAEIRKEDLVVLVDPGCLRELVVVLQVTRQVLIRTPATLAVFTSPGSFAGRNG